ncbi:MAG: hypothetical protein LBK22_01825 [Tannerella sp.]|jgi:hypothetical protein|nr:hypothetical protein [Tannerella sp.]
MAKKKRAVKKKYVSVAEQQRLHELQQQKIFLDKLQNLCLQIGGDASLFHQIPVKEKTLLFMFRGASLKVVAAEGAKIPKRLMDALAKTIKTYQITMKMETVKGSGQMMTYADYFLAGKPLEYIMTKEEIEFPGKERFADYVATREERLNTYACGLEDICNAACLLFDDLGRKHLYTYTIDFSVPGLDGIPKPQSENYAGSQWQRYSKQDFRIHQKVMIGTCPLEVRKVSVNGETHSAIQVGIMLYQADKTKPFQISMSPGGLNTNRNTPFSSLELPVYIQQHALDRMKERLGLTMTPFYSPILIIDALLRKETVPLSKSRMLIACFVSDLKVGYFVAGVTDGIILIRTFLLLTNGGTPEGDKLSQLTGLQAEDRRYLAIDTLPGLANSDIERNEIICSRFREAGCGSILKLCKRMNDDPGLMWLLDKSQPKNIVSDLITEYLKTDSDGDEEDAPNPE